MTTQEIKELVLIRNKEINNEIKNIKELYDIEVTNELLENLIQFSLNAIEYYNEKYNYFKGDKYEQLYLFGMKFHNIHIYNYNLLNSSNHQDEKYKKFILLFDQKSLTKILNELFIVIQVQITLHEKRDTYVFNDLKKIDNTKLSIDDIIELNYPPNETELMLIYIYLYHNDNLNICLQNIKTKIENDLPLIKNGISTLVEDIIFNFVEIAEKTNLNSKYYLQSFYEQNANYNYEIHCNILQNIKGMLKNEL